jgi:hypothetical protein
MTGAEVLSSGDSPATLILAGFKPKINSFAKGNTALMAKLCLKKAKQND